MNLPLHPSALHLQLWKDKINFKLPGGQAFEPHQDVQARWNTYNQSFHVSLVIAIDPANKSNGPLEVAPFAAARRDMLGAYGTRLSDDVEAALDWKMVEMEPGDR